MPDHGLLWATWRARWIEQLASGRPEGCPFCAARAEAPCEANLVVHRGRSAFVVLNLYPYNGGHLLCVPERHVPRLRDLSLEERSELLELAVLSQRVLEATHRPQGFNLGVNEGRSAGAGVEDHLHLHVLPRWDGDAHFLSALQTTRILSQSLEDTWREVREGFAQAVGGAPGKV